MFFVGTGIFVKILFQGIAVDEIWFCFRDGRLYFFKGVRRGKLVPGIHENQVRAPGALYPLVHGLVNSMVRLADPERVGMWQIFL